VASVCALCPHLHGLLAGLGSIPHGGEVRDLDPLILQHALLLSDAGNVVLQSIPLTLQQLLLLQSSQGPCTMETSVMF
jgi:hypothetical protein